MPLLLLGGTSDARHLATKLQQQGVSLIYSVAGLVRTPDVPCEIVSGGFTQFGGLVEYIKEKNIRAILDVTHPYAQTMSTKAVNAAKKCCIPCWRFHRPAWQQSGSDAWFLFKNWQTLLPALADKQTIFFTSGQLEPEVLKILEQQAPKQYLLRTAVKPKVVLPQDMQWIKAIGPFSLDNELALMREHGVDALVSKNSGGEATEAKLHAARELAIPVYMLDRPNLPTADEIFTEPKACEDFVVKNYRER